MLGPCGHSRAPVPWSLGSLCPTEDKVSVTTFAFFIHVNPGFRFSPNNKPTEDKPGFSFSRYELQEHGENPHVRRRPCLQPLPCSAADGLCCGAPARPWALAGELPRAGRQGRGPGTGLPRPGVFQASRCPLPVFWALFQSLAATPVTHRPGEGRALVHSDHSA